MNVAEKAAYIKGLMDGMKFSTETDEGKLIKNIVDLLEDLALSVQDLEDETANIGDYVDELDHDLSDVEEEVYGYSDECEDDECDCGDECDCEDECDCDDECDCGCGCEEEESEAGEKN